MFCPDRFCHLCCPHMGEDPNDNGKRGGNGWWTCQCRWTRGTGGALHPLLCCYPLVLFASVTQRPWSDPFLCEQVRTEKEHQLAKCKQLWAKLPLLEIAFRAQNWRKSASSPAQVQPSGAGASAQSNTFCLWHCFCIGTLANVAWHPRSLKGDKGNPEWALVQPSLLGDMNAELKLK